MQRSLASLGSVILSLSSMMLGGPLLAQEILVADGNAWPGRILKLRGGDSSVLYQRPLAQTNNRVPRVQSVTQLQDGRLAFCSGLDRSIMILDANGEQELHHGGYLARQVRTDTNGDLYWSGVETPLNGNPLPDGFIYRYDATTRQVETVLTFSQGDVERDWWGAFDVRQGRIFVATLKQPTRIYEIEHSLPRFLFSLPTAASAIRFDQDGAFLVSDGAGQLVRYPDPRHPETSQRLLESHAAFADFVVGPRL